VRITEVLPHSLRGALTEPEEAARVDCDGVAGAVR
jgi:hypothetical protein